DLNVRDFTQSVRQSENFTIDQFSGRVLSRLNDLHKFLGTDLNTPVIEGVTTSGVIEDVIAIGSGDMDRVDAFSIRANEVEQDLLVFDENLLPRNRTRFHFVNSISRIETTSDASNLSVITGELPFFIIGGRATDVDLRVAGTLGLVDIDRTMDEESSIFVSGPNGNVGTIRVGQNLKGTINVTGSVDEITVGNHLRGQITIDGSNQLFDALGRLYIGNRLIDGVIDIMGNVGTIESAKSLGLQGAELTIDGNLDNLLVGTSSAHDGAELAATLLINGDLLNAEVTGRVSNRMVIKGDSNTFSVTADAKSANQDILTADVTVLGRARNVTFTGGNVAAGFRTGENLQDMRITDGNLAESGEVASAFGDVQRVRIDNGDLLGAVRAENGQIGQIDVSGSNMGANAVISALSADSINFDGTMLAGALIDVLNQLGSLVVGVDIQAGATVRAGGADRVDVGNDIFGALMLGAQAALSRVEVGRDVRGQIHIDTDADLRIGRNLMPDAVLQTGVSVSGDAVLFDVGDTVFGDVFVDGTIASFSAQAITSAVITAGHNIDRMIVDEWISHSLIQAGVSRGEDGMFATTLAGTDFGETARAGSFDLLRVEKIDESVIAAGGKFRRLDVRDEIENSSVSSGFNVG
ncbi:MAG: hypothetical protein QF735_08460, partial [Phycisphaeraceae bacterium]|nr:hypothetical protein [Phycisphaeraceae bacterium]